MEDLKEKNCETLFPVYSPTLTFKGETELLDKKCGLDGNIYSFLQCCSLGYSFIEIAVSLFLSVEEAAKYLEFCIEQDFIKQPENDIKK